MDILSARKDVSGRLVSKRSLGKMKRESPSSSLERRCASWNVVLQISTYYLTCAELLENLSATASPNATMNFVQQDEIESCCQCRD